MNDVESDPYLYKCISRHGKSKILRPDVKYLEVTCTTLELSGHRPTNFNRGYGGGGGGYGGGGGGGDGGSSGGPPPRGGMPQGNPNDMFGGNVTFTTSI